MHGPQPPGRVTVGAVSPTTRLRPCPPSFSGRGELPRTPDAGEDDRCEDTAVGKPPVPAPRPPPGTPMPRRRPHPPAGLRPGVRPRTPTLRRDDPRGTPSAPGQLRTGQPRLRNRQIRVTVQAGPDILRHPGKPAPQATVLVKQPLALLGQQASRPHEFDSALRRRIQPLPQHIPSRVQQHIPAACRTGRGAGAGPAGPVCVRPRRLPASSPARPSPRRGGRRGRAGRPGSRVRGGAGFSGASRPNRPPLPGRCPPRYSDGPASHAPPSLPRTPFPAPSLFLLRGSPGGFPGTVAKNRPPGIFWRRPHPWTVRPAPAERVPGPRRTKPQEAVRGPRGRQKAGREGKGGGGETPCRAGARPCAAQGPVRCVTPYGMPPDAAGLPCPRFPDPARAPASGPSSPPSAAGCAVLVADATWSGTRWGDLG